MKDNSRNRKERKTRRKLEKLAFFFAISPKQQKIEIFADLW